MKFIQNNHPTRLVGTWEYVCITYGHLFNDLTFISMYYMIPELMYYPHEYVRSLNIFLEFQVAHYRGS